MRKQWKLISGHIQTDRFLSGINIASSNVKLMFPKEIKKSTINRNVQSLTYVSKLSSKRHYDERKKSKKDTGLAIVEQY